MNVGQLINILEWFDQTLEVTLFDGFEGRLYKAQNGYDLEISVFEGVLDIGIGGLLVENPDEI